MPSGTRMGHVHLQVAELAQIEASYDAVLTRLEAAGVPAESGPDGHLVRHASGNSVLLTQAA